MPGAIKSTYDPRDWVFEKLILGRDGRYMHELPEEFNLQEHSQPTRDQGNRSTCAAFAGSAIKEIHEKQKSSFNEWMSPEFIYFYRDNKPISGMCGRNVFRVLQKIGSVPESSYNYESVDNNSKAPTKKQLQTAAQYRITNYARIETIAGVKRALIEIGPVYISLPLYKRQPEFWRPLQSEKCSVGHAAVIVGYNSQGFIIRNSWGDDWNGDGHILFPYEDWPKHWECWACIDAEKGKKSCTII